MELAEQLDELVLSRSAFPEAAIGDLPQLLNRPCSVHAVQDQPRGRVETMHAPRGRVLHDEPDLAPIVVTVQARVRTQPGLQCGDAIPGTAEERLAHPALT